MAVAEWLRLAGTSGSIWSYPCPLSSRDTQSRLPSTTSRQLLKFPSIMQEYGEKPQRTE